MQIFRGYELSQIHNASMEILRDTGVKFNSSNAIELFQKNGFKTDGLRVFITEKDVRRALELVPSRFTIRARNPAYDKHEQ